MKKLLLTFLIIITVIATSSCTFFDLDGVNNNNNNNNINNSVYRTAFEQVSRTDKPVLTGPEIYNKVVPSMVSIVNYGSTSTSEGSGIIMSEDGYIITNAHVVEKAQTLKVYLYDDTEYLAEDFWYDTYTDLAVIKINKTGLTPAEFGNSDEVLIGEEVYAIGNPGGMEFKYSITKGIISYKYRAYSPIEDSGYTINVLQIDATINPGNSGGALVNVYGQVIGINSAKIVSEGFEGMGFSISINDALPILSSLESKGYVEGRPALGITYQLISSGMQIISINVNSDLKNKGLKAGDIITKINNVTINSAAAIKSSLKGKRAGDTVTLTYKKYSDNYNVYTTSVVLMDACLL
jgi:serine protease Do